MKKVKRLSAGALQYVVFISVLIALFISAFMLLLYLNKLVALKATTFQKQVHKTELALDYATQHTFAYKDSIQVPSPEEKEQQIKTILYKTSWGVFDKVQAITTFKKQIFNKTALLGGFTENRPALYLQATNKPLVLVGDTEIIGTVFLPSQGVKRGTIAGKSFSGKQLINGTKRSSRRNLPTIRNRENIKAFCKGNYTLEPIFINLEEERVNQEELVHSFEEKTKIYQTDRIIDLKDISITGNYLIQSNTLIRVHASAKLKDIILIAPQIEIEENVTGNFQAFASENITVKPNGILTYPTALVVSEDLPKINQQTNQQESNYNKPPKGILISENVSITGSVLFLSNNLQDNFKSQIRVFESAQITGEVYGERNVEIKGTITGTVYAKNVITNAFGSVYVNHLYNVNLNSTALPKSFGSLLYKKQDKKMVQWLY